MGIGETVPRAPGLSRSDWGYESEGDRKGLLALMRSAATEGVSGKPFPVPRGCHEVTGDTRPKAIEKGYWPVCGAQRPKGFGETIPRASGLSRSDWGYENRRR